MQSWKDISRADLYKKVLELDKKYKYETHEKKKSNMKDLTEMLEYERMKFPKEEF